MKKIKSYGYNYIIITNNNNNNTYTILNPVVGDAYLVPFDGRQYWEHHFVPKDTWVRIKDINFDEWSFTKKEWELYCAKSDEQYKEILAKYHGSF